MPMDLLLQIITLSQRTMEAGGPMRNITVSVDDDIYHRARLFAAKWDTSVSALVANFLEHMPLFSRLLDDARAADAAKANALANTNASIEKTSS